MLASFLLNEKVAISQPKARKKKKKGILLASTLKVGREKVPIFFCFLALGLRYCHIVILEVAPC